MYSISIRTHIQHIFPITGQRRYHIASYIDEGPELMCLCIEADNTLAHSTQIKYVADAGDIVVRAKMFVFYYIMIRDDFLVGKCQGIKSVVGGYPRMPSSLRLSPVMILEAERTLGSMSFCSRFPFL